MLGHRLIGHITIDRLGNNNGDVYKRQMLVLSCLKLFHQVATFAWRFFSTLGFSSLVSVAAKRWLSRGNCFLINAINLTSPSASLVCSAAEVSVPRDLSLIHI